MQNFLGNLLILKVGQHVGLSCYFDSQFWKQYKLVLMRCFSLASQTQLIA